MKNNELKRNEQNNIVIILPKPETPPIKRITIFLLGMAFTLMFVAYINFNESLGLITFGILAFLFIFDEGFRRLF